MVHPLVGTPQQAPPLGRQPLGRQPHIMVNQQVVCILLDCILLLRMNTPFQQEHIPVGCVLTTTVASITGGWYTLPLGIPCPTPQYTVPTPSWVYPNPSPHGYTLPPTERAWYQRYPIPLYPTTLLLWAGSQTPVKTLPSRNFVCGR